MNRGKKRIENHYSTRSKHIINIGNGTKLQAVPLDNGQTKIPKES